MGRYRRPAGLQPALSGLLRQGPAHRRPDRQPLCRALLSFAAPPAHLPAGALCAVRQDEIRQRGLRKGRLPLYSRRRLLRPGQAGRERRAAALCRHPVRGPVRHPLSRARGGGGRAAAAGRDRDVRGRRLHFPQRPQARRLRGDPGGTDRRADRVSEAAAEQLYRAALVRRAVAAPCRPARRRGQGSGLFLRLRPEHQDGEDRGGLRPARRHPGRPSRRLPARRRPVLRRAKCSTRCPTSSCRAARNIRRSKPCPTRPC